MQERQITGRQFFEAGKDAPEPFNFVNKSFNQISFFVKLSVVVPRMISRRSWRNDDLNALLLQPLDQRTTVVSLVANKIVGLLACA